jgi:hypothetical protein
MVACSTASDTLVRKSTDAVAAPQRIVEPLRLLDIASQIDDQQMAANGSCLKTGSPPERSRLLYMILPRDSSHLRLNVVTSSDGNRVNMIDLVRGSGAGTLWAATQIGATASIVTRAFTSISDRAPTLGSLPADGQEAQLLRAIAAAAIRVSCVDS